MCVENGPEEGPSDHIALPTASFKCESSTVTNSPTQSQNPAGHLLVVDDEPNIRNLIAKFLQMELYTVDLAERAEEAWSKVQHMAYDCILLDLKMPGMSGERLYQLIEAHDQQMAEKVIFITGDTANPSTRNFIAETSNRVIIKPFQLEELRRLVLEVVR